MRESAQLVSKTLGMLAPLIVPGAIPLDLDKHEEEFPRPWWRSTFLSMIFQ